MVDSTARQYAALIRRAPSSPGGTASRGATTHWADVMAPSGSRRCSECQPAGCRCVIRVMAAPYPSFGRRTPRGVLVSGPMRIGLLTGGGDCPGLNAVIRAVTRLAIDRGDRVTGILHGWRGLIEAQSVELGARDVSGILPRGGTILKTSRTNPYRIDGGVERVLANLRELDALVAIGGEDTLGVAARLHAEHGCHIVGVPKTIDNDLNATDVTFGFD